MLNPLVITIALALICLSSLAGAIYLQTQSIDANQAWAGFIGSLGALLGQQIESPVGKGVGK